LTLSTDNYPLRMTIKQQLLQEITSSSDEILAETLDFLKFLKNRKSEESLQQTATTSTGKSLLQHIENLGSWSGADLEESLQSVKETHSPAKFDLDNPFDEN